jgi:hypothetical protein
VSEHAYGAGTIQGVAKKLGVHRRMVREALADAVARERKIAIRPKPRLAAVRSFIEAILEADQTAPRKQRHTARRIWCRIRAEMPEERRRVIDSSIRSRAEDSTAIVPSSNNQLPIVGVVSTRFPSGAAVQPVLRLALAG